MSGDLRHPNVFVIVPRAALPTYMHQPWADVLAAAERGTDGLAVSHARPRVWRGSLQDGDPEVLDVAFVAQGQYHFSEKTVLYQQNW